MQEKYINKAPVFNPRQSRLRNMKSVLVITSNHLIVCIRIVW
ncbi:unnamed protein product [Acanthoscelides obtectus]|uniref:Uncharacterized protein n=1 Tax=Acanthoscelides obtectus TaxID=200917 RepID=A0A9P0Q0F6_ACAOB|nr:unnamed protein product [Acanthoscelides obtectus]CAK1672201.1 hypothetical protein AOBTE_LOCUS28713 [Acanthoscelides obtectus]